MTFPLLAGLRVLDLSTGIPGAYATKLLHDAGADVVKVEPEDGDPLRRWTASGVELGATDGALFRFLSRGKRSVVGEVDTLLARADLVVESGQLPVEAIEGLLARRSGASVVSVTPFGRRGPWADRPATDFTLQAWCGTLAFRGLPEREPLQVGGRVGEWLAGVYTACGAMGVVLGARRTGRGDHVDVSILECMIERLGGVSALSASLTGYRHELPIRTLEFPSIDASADGFIGVAPMTAQNFSDLLVMMGRADLAEDKDLASFPGRWRRRHELKDVFRAWSTKHTTAELLEQAAAFRVPAAPVASPETVTTIDHYVERGAFVAGPGGDFVAPRIPYQIDGRARTPEGRAPRLGEHTGGVAWPVAADREPAPPSLPLDGLRVVDFTSFWAGPIATQLLATFGADVIHVESTRRPDGYRFIRLSATDLPDDWWERSAGFHAMNTNKRGITLDIGDDEGRELLLCLVEHADVFVENYAPRVLENVGLSVELLRQRNPRLIITRMPAFGLSGPWRDRTGFASTIEAASGLAWRTGYEDSAATTLRGPADPIAGLHAAFAVLATLHDRAGTGEGHTIEASMIEAALNTAAELAIEHSAYGASLTREGNRGPDAAPQGLYPCLGHEQWLALAVVDDGHWAGLRKALGDPRWARSPAFESAAGRRQGHDELDRHLSEWAAGQELEAAVTTLLDHGVPAAPVLDPLLLTGSEHLAARGFYEPLESALLGRHTISSLPMRFASRAEPWTRFPGPTLGQHNHEVLGVLLGVGDDRLTDLEARQVIGTRPLGLS